MFLRGMVEIHRLEKMMKVMTEQSHRDAAVVYILRGKLARFQRNNGKFEQLDTVRQGECVGQLSFLSDDPSCYTYEAMEPTLVALVTKTRLAQLVHEQPKILLSLAHSSVAELSPLARQLDFALDWVLVEAGRAVTSPGVNTDNVYIILSGRLVSDIADADASSSSSYGKGQMVGIVDVLMERSREKSYMAVRDSELCLIPRQTMRTLQDRCRTVLSELNRVLGDRLSNNNTAKYVKFFIQKSCPGLLKALHLFILGGRERLIPAR